MTSTVTESASDRLSRLSQRRDELQEQRDQLAEDLAALEREHDELVIDGGDPGKLAARRRALLEEVEAVDRAITVLEGPIAAAQAEIAEQEARRELGEVRRQLDTHTTQAHERAAQLGDEVGELVRAVAEAARTVVELVAASDADNAEVTRLLGLERSLAERVGETPRQAPQPVVRAWSNGQPIAEMPSYETGIPERITADARLLVAARRNPREALQELARLAEHQLAGGGRG